MFSDRMRDLMERGKGARFSFPAGREENLLTKVVTENGSTNVAERVVRRYLANMQLTKALAGAYGVRVAFIWQPIPTYKYDLRYHRFQDSGFRRHRNAPSVYERMSASRARLSGERSFIWCADLQEGAAESFYLDEVHYNAALARRLAAKIGEELVARGLTEVP